MKQVKILLKKKKISFLFIHFYKNKIEHNSKESLQESLSKAENTLKKLATIYKLDEKQTRKFQNAFFF